MHIRFGTFVRSPRTTAISLGLLTATLVIGALIARPPQSTAALLGGGNNPDILIGRDDDNVNNPIIQPPNTVANQSLNNTDAIAGGGGNDILVGLLGSDVLLGGPGNDIFIGGPEGFVAPNSDVISGDEGNDISIWAPGDGSDVFVGGEGLDAQVFGVIDRNSAGVPTAGGSAPGFAVVPGANVTGQPGFCTLERSPDPSYQFLVRFFVRATGALAVTVRLVDVEQLFCTSQAGGQITYADLTSANPQLTVVRQADVEQLNAVVGRIIR
jgi:Ca2+-binding RTX toxin-like protein